MFFDTSHAVWIFVLHLVVIRCQLPKLQPGDLAPSFALQTLNGRIVYRKGNSTSRTPTHPVIFHLFTRRSAFLEALWNNDTSLEEFLELSPGNTHYVFMSSADSRSMYDILWMRTRLHRAIEKYYLRKINQLKHRFKKSCQQQFSSSAHHFLHAHRAENVEKEPFEKLSVLKQHHSTLKTTACNKSWIQSWKDRLHFTSLPVYEFGNWIPYASMHWPCFGSGCALAQVIFKSREGEVVLVAKRLDARYDWLPSPHNLIHKHSHFIVSYYGNACSLKPEWTVAKKRLDDDKKQKKKTSEGRIALVSPGDCSLFTKIRHMSQAGVHSILLYPEANEPIKELTCNSPQCFIPLHISASMISHKDGCHIRKLLDAKMKLFVSYQFTPQENFFLAIDGQGKLSEVGLFLFPSLKFLAYEAKWFNYKTDLIHNLTGSSRIIPVFNYSHMEGKSGAVKSIQIPPLKELQLYRNVELDMALHCPGKSDYSCPHWDHLVRLTVCCDKENPLCGEELGRWITPYRRSVGRWLTNITPLLPLFTSENCTLQMKHPFWERAWKPSLNIRLSDHIKFSKHQYSGKREDEYNVPYKIIKLFRGGKFDKNYNNNKKYSRMHTFRIPAETERVKLVATISGHGSDNNGCAEFCVTSHHFIVNGHSNDRAFKNAATAMGCANRVSEGAVPNEHGTWLYGRDGWCCGMDVVPWVVDITDQVKIGGRENKVRYVGLFNGTDPNPTRDPGSIELRSYLVYYKSVEDQFSGGP